MEVHKNGQKKLEILTFLNDTVFNPILDSDRASDKLKAGIRLTLNRMATRDAAGIVHFYWSALAGTEQSVSFARHMREEGFVRFEEIIEDFRNRFNDKWLRA